MATTANVTGIPAVSTIAPSPASRKQAATPSTMSSRRVIPREAGMALEILGHAIEYLTDEYVHNGGSLSAKDPQVQAIQLLMALNREVYYECPMVPTLSARLLHFLGVRQG